VAALRNDGASVVIGSRRGNHAGRWALPFQHLCRPEDWRAVIAGFDAVLNCVGILRERIGQSYQRVHSEAPAALAAACAERGIRLLHVSALGLDAAAGSRFIRSKRDGERAILAAGGEVILLRPSLLDGEGGYGARWLRRVARWPVYFPPQSATGRIAALQVSDLAAAVLRLLQMPSIELARHAPERICELGGSTAYTLCDYLRQLRSARLQPARVLAIPHWLTRGLAHLCDLLHFSPFSFGHLELLARDNLPRHNALPALLGRAPTPIGLPPPDRASGGRESGARALAQPAG
jgi:NADH dehydrogenase